MHIFHQHRINFTHHLAFKHLVLELWMLKDERKEIKIGWLDTRAGNFYTFELLWRISQFLLVQNYYLLDHFVFTSKYIFRYCDLFWIFSVVEVVSSRFWCEPVREIPCMVCVKLLEEEVLVVLSLVDISLAWFEQTLKRTLNIYEEIANWIDDRSMKMIHDIFHAIPKELGMLVIFEHSCIPSIWW